MSTTTIGPPLRALRTRSGMSLEQVADASGVSATYLAAVENDQVKPSSRWVGLVAVSIADYLRKPDASEAGSTVAATNERKNR